MSTSFYIVDTARKTARWTGPRGYWTSYAVPCVEDSFIASLVLPVPNVAFNIPKDFKARVTEITYDEFIIQLTLGVIPPLPRNGDVPRNCRYFAYKEPYDYK